MVHTIVFQLLSFFGLSFLIVKKQMFDFEIIPSLGNVKSYHGGYQNPKYRRQEDNTMSQKGRKEKNNTQQNIISKYIA